MSRQSKFNLGEKVAYIRINPETGDAETGEGVVFGNVITINQRLNVQVKDGDRVYNLEEGAINLTEEQRVAYVYYIKRLRAMVDDHNKRSQQIIKDGQKLVDEMNAEFFGPAIEL